MDKSDHYEIAKQIMQDALDVAVDERESWVVEQCGNDAELLHSVLSLLENEQLLTIGPSVSQPESFIEIGKKIGPYTVLEFIGEGGFAEVFLAQQSEPVERKVALKILKSGMSSREVLTRFNSERQALAMMQHSGIAKIFDAGISEGGRSWFSMEYVAGIPITDYSDSNRLGLSGRLSLFRQVCEAVQHAHQKGIIHRDLKPSNILVGLSEGEPKVKVIDFGVAKATGGSLTGQTLFTEKGVLIGTPAYMSPEQAVSTELDIDTRSDVYSLGVVLYELLSGAPPFDPKMLRDAAFGEIHRIIQQEDPVRPSTKLTSVEEAANIAKARRLSISSLSRRLRGDLDWITLKALEKDRTRRYSSVGDFASDLQRYLLSEPVTAGPPSTFYKFRKFTKRNRVSVTAAVAVFCVLVIGVVTTSLQWVRASKAEEKVSVEKDKVLAEKERLQKMVDFQADIFTGLDSEKVGQTLDRLLTEAISQRVQSRGGSEEEARKAIETFKSLSSRGIATDVAKKLLDEELLSPAVEEVSDRISGDPLTELRIRESIAQAYWDLDMTSKTEKELSKSIDISLSSLGGDHADTLKLLGNKGMLLAELGDLETAEKIYRDVLLRQMRDLPENDPDILLTKIRLADLLDDSLEFEKVTEAEALLRTVISALESRSSKSDLAIELRMMAEGNLGNLLVKRGLHDEAGVLLKKALADHQERYGPEAYDTMVCLNNMALWFEDDEQYDQAKSLLGRAVEISRRVKGNQSDDTIIALNNLGLLLVRLSEWEAAEPVLRESLAGYVSLYDSSSNDVLSSKNALSLTLFELGELEESKILITEIIGGYRKKWGAENEETLDLINRLGVIHLEMGELQKGQPFILEALQGRRKVLGGDNIETLNSVGNMAMILWDQNNNVEAEKFFRELVVGYKKLLGPDDNDTLYAISCLASLLIEELRLDEAEKILIDSMADNPNHEVHQDVAAGLLKQIKEIRGKKK